MSLHRSLKTKPSALNQHRNVLTRGERIGRLEEQEKFRRDQQSPLGLIKVANRMVAAAKKAKKEAVEGEAGAEGAAAPAAGAAAAPAGAAKAPAAKAPAKK
jgi:small basic protein (TIGR04137 family)